MAVDLSGDVPAGALARICASFIGQRLLVVGDVMLDEYIYGSVSRISPEAPVPILEADPQRRTYVPGGAANVARNLAAMGAQVAVVGIVGADREADTMRSLLDRAGIAHDGLVCDPARPTTLKTRIVAHNQQVVRVDHEDRTPIGEQLRGLLDDAIEAQGSRGIRGIVVSDYDKGVVKDHLADSVRRVARRFGLLCTANAKPANAERYAGYDLVTLNRSELAAVARSIGIDAANVERGASQVRAALGYEQLAVTLGADGIMIADGSVSAVHVPAVPVDVFDVVGAGDTALGAMTLARLAGASALETAWIGNLAGGAVVRKAGTATVTVEEILELLDDQVRHGRLPASSADDGRLG